MFVQQPGNQSFSASTEVRRAYLENPVKQLPITTAVRQDRGRQTYIERRLVKQFLPNNRGMYHSGHQMGVP